MKLSDLKYNPLVPLFMALYLLMVVLSANVVLCFTEGMSWQANLANILLPCGIYMWLMTLSPNIGRTVWFFFPFLFLSAFQVVLLYLFGNSIIAVDMFLNLVTSNPSEMAELLGDMWIIVLTVILFWVPLLLTGALFWKGKIIWLADSRLKFRKTGLAVGALGILAVILAYLSGPKSAIEGATHYNITTQLFPVNATANGLMAVDRTRKIHRYHDSSASFVYDARSVRPDTLPELYIMVIGETSRADNWELAGYERATNPRLSRRDGLIFYSRAMSESNTTHKSVPMLMSSVDATAFDSLYCRKGILAAFNEAGYATSFISGQQRNGQLIDFLGEEASHCTFVKDTMSVTSTFYDMDLIPYIEKEIRECSKPKQMIVVHTYGSHFKYNDRYPEQFRRYAPDSPLFTDSRFRDRLVNAYDNTILYTDALVDSIISVAEATGKMSAVIYTSDHGEDLFDDSRNRFLHSSPTPTAHQLHVPMLLWTSPSWRRMNPEEDLASLRNGPEQVSSSRSLFHTALQLAGIETPLFRSCQSLVSPDYKPAPRYYLTDHNRAVDYKGAGMKEPDFSMLRSLAIR